MIAGTLEIQMAANLARLAQDMAKSKALVTDATTHISNVVGVARAALGTLGIGLGVGYFVSLIKGSIDAADHLNDLSKTTLLSVETLSGLKLTAKQSGSDLDSLAQAISKLGQNIGKEPERFRQLGISAKDPLEAFKQLSDIFVKLQDPHQRAAVMAAALGKSWQGAAPALAEGSKRIQEMVDRGMRLSGMTKELAEESDRLKDKQAELQTSLERTINKLVIQLLPTLNDTVRAMAQAADEGGPFLVFWVALGGAMDATVTSLGRLFGRMKEYSRGAEIKALEEDTARLLKSLQGFSSSVNPGVRARHEEQIAQARARLELLKHEEQVEKEVAASKDGQSKKDAADAAARKKDAADAVARADIFLHVTKQRDEAYARLLRSVTDLTAAQQAELETGEKLTESQKLALKIMVELRDGKEKFTDAQKRSIAVALEEALATGQLLQAREREREVNKAIQKQLEDEEAQRSRVNAVVWEAMKAHHQQGMDIEFETDQIKREAVLYERAIMTREDELRLMSKVSAAREIANELRRIELQLQRDLLALGPETNTGYEEAARRLREMAEAQKAVAPDAITARENAKLTNQLRQESVKEFREIWQTVESTGRAAFIHLASDGKASFKSIGEAIKTSVIDLLYQLTLKKWIIQIGAQIETSTTGGGGGGVGGGILGQLFGGLFSGGGGATAGATASSSMGAGFGVFAAGTDYVPRTGLAFLHQGEAVLSADENAARAGGGVVTIINNIDARVDQAQVARLVEAGVQRGLAVYQDRLYRGKTAEAMGVRRT